jgi:hypothetical protein
MEESYVNGVLYMSPDIVASQKADGFHKEEYNPCIINFDRLVGELAYHTWTEVAHLHNVSVYTIKKWCIQFGISTTRTEIKPTYEELINKLAYDNEARLREKYNCDGSVIVKWLEYYEIPNDRKIVGILHDAMAGLPTGMIEGEELWVRESLELMAEDIYGAIAQGVITVEDSTKEDIEYFRKRLYKSLGIQ